MAISHTCVQERVCEDSASFDLTSMDIAHCISDITHLLVAKKEEESLEEEGGREGPGCMEPGPHGRPLV